MFLSIITPTYKRYHYLKKNLEILKKLEKKFKHFEWIIIAEKKDTKDNIKKYVQLKKRYKFIKLILGNYGNVEKCFNVGVENSSGKYLSFHGDDDFYDIKNLNLLNKDLFKKDYEWIIFQGSYYDENYKLIRRKITKLKNFFLKKNSLIKVSYINYIMTPSIFVRKKILLELGGIVKYKRAGSDYLLWMNFAQKYKPKIINKNLSFCIYSTSTVTGRIDILNDIYLLFKMAQKNLFNPFGILFVMFFQISKIFYNINLKFFKILK